MAGDYIVTVSARPVDGTAKSADFRITVSTSTLWGVAGLALIAIAVQEASKWIDKALEKVSLSKVAGQSVRTFSRGMRERLGVADVLIKNPQLIIMDEPTQGLDPELAREFLDLIRELVDAGITILLSSHLLYQVQEVRDRVGLFHFLKFFTTARDPLPAFAGFLGFRVPLVAISLAFDSINGEFNRRTLSRELSQPIYRDALLLGKFLGGFFTLALVLSAIWLLVFGIGLLGMGVPPTGPEVARSLLFLLATIVYGGFWMALALLFSTLFNQSATAALASIAVWLFFTVFWGILASLLAQSLKPIQYGFLDEALAQANLQLALSRFSPNTLFVETTVRLLSPAVRSLGLFLPFELEGAVLGAPLPVGQSLLIIWPNLTGLIAATILLFVLSYVSFQRREIRT